MFKIRTYFILFVCACSLLQISSVIAEDLGRFGGRIFNFQKKMALKGNMLAQYKLGALYEFGIAVKPNVNEAKVWYEKAAKQGYKVAANRLTYLDVKQNGYNQSKHGAWFKNIKSEAKALEPNALILLGQMHRYGIVVKKDLKKALVMLEKASSQGHTEVDFEVEEIIAELDASNAKKEQPKVVEVKKPKKEKKSIPKTVKKTVAKSVRKKAAAEKKKKDDKQAKRQKYEEMMRKLYKEQLILQQQQEWSESESDSEE